MSRFGHLVWIPTLHTAGCSNAYTFYFGNTALTDTLTFPVTPEALETTIQNKNETITLINEGEINLPKKAGLTEISFTARFPRRKQPYVCTNKLYAVDHYLGILETLKLNKLAFSFHVVRTHRLSSGAVGHFESTSMTVTLEEYTIKEDSENGDDLMVDISLKQYKSFSATRKTITNNGTVVNKPTNTTPTNTPTNATKTTYYTVKKGDTLQTISKKFYGKYSLYTKIYNANKSTIENAAKKRGRKSSGNGHWIYPNTKLVIPK